MIYTLIGLVGTFLYFLSYFLLNTQRIEGLSVKYIGINLIASLCVLISLSQNWNLPSAIIQIGWAILSVLGLFNLSNQKKKADIKNA
jgi:hypothetical protein